MVGSLQKRLQSAQTTWNRRMSCALWHALRFESRNMSTCECTYHCVTVELLTAMRCQIVITISEFLWGIEWNNMEWIFQNDTSSNKTNMLMTGSHPWFPSGFTVERIDSPTIFGFLPIWGRANPKLQRDNPVRKVFLKLGRYTSQAMTRLSTCRNSNDSMTAMKGI